MGRGVGRDQGSRHSCRVRCSQRSRACRLRRSQGRRSISDIPEGQPGSATAGEMETGIYALSGIIDVIYWIEHERAGGRGFCGKHHLGDLWVGARQSRMVGIYRGWSRGVRGFCAAGAAPK